MDNVAAALQQPKTPSKHDEPCGPGDDKRSSDLCAQWKAADAARSAADAAWWIGIVGSLIGALTLAAAFTAARWAKKAAIETGKGATAADKAVIETQRIGEAQVRCYLTGVDAELGFAPQGTAVVNCTVRNSGNSPAKAVKCSGEVWFKVNGEFEGFDEAAGSFHDFVVDIGADTDATLSFCVEASMDGWGPPEHGMYYISATLRLVGTDVFGKPVAEVEKFIAFPAEKPGLNSWIKMRRSTRMTE